MLLTGTLISVPFHDAFGTQYQKRNGFNGRNRIHLSLQCVVKDMECGPHQGVSLKNPPLKVPPILNQARSAGKFFIKEIL